MTNPHVTSQRKLKYFLMHSVHSNSLLNCFFSILWWIYLISFREEDFDENVSSHSLHLFNMILPIDNLLKTSYCTHHIRKRLPFNYLMEIHISSAFAIFEEYFLLHSIPLYNHSSGGFLSIVKWILLTWLDRLIFAENFLSQMVQSYNCLGNFKWTCLMCRSKFNFLAKFFAHSPHSYVFSGFLLIFKWICLTCRQRALLWEYFWLQTSHLYDSSWPVLSIFKWKYFICRCKWHFKE
jgi:hypothetical protein